MAKKKYFDNNWELFKEAPDDFFLPHTYEEVMEWKVQGWELPSSVCCIVRVTDVETQKTKEFVYRKPGHAKRKLDSLFHEEGIEFSVVDHESIHHFFPESMLNDKDWTNTA